MSRLTSGHHSLLSRRRGGGWGGRSSLAKRSEYLGPHPGWVLAGLVAVGLGIFAIYTIEPELRRYMKIKSM